MEQLPVIEGFVFHTCIAETVRSHLWRCTQVALDRDVLIQIYRPDVFKNTVLRYHSFAVVKALSHIKSSIFPSVIDVINTGDQYYSIMEDAHSVPLSTLLAGGRMAATDLLVTAIKIAKGFQVFYNETHMIYRNLKPAMIHVSDSDEPIVIDASLAIFDQPRSDVIALDGHVIIGTPSYISPEQYDAPNTLDARSDIYSFGATLYTLLTGWVPFNGSDALSTIHMKSRTSLPSPCDAADSIPKGFGDVIAKMMMRKREDRYPSWEAVVEDLLLLGGGGSPEPPDYSKERSSILPPSGKQDLSSMPTVYVKAIAPKNKTQVRTLPRVRPHAPVSDAPVAPAMKKTANIVWAVVVVMVGVLVGIGLMSCFLQAMKGKM